MTARVVVVGAGGHGREVLDVLEARHGVDGGFEILGVLDDAPSELNLKRLSERGIGYLGSIRSWAPGADRDVRYLIGIGNPAVRRAIDANLTGEGFEPATVVHPSAVTGSGVHLSPGVVVCAGAVLTTNIRVGRHTHFNFASTVGHDCRIGDFVMVNPAANISGDCTIEDGVLIGAGAVVLQGRTVRRGATVGASACVTRDVLPDTVAIGIPARASMNGAANSGQPVRNDIRSTAGVSGSSLSAGLGWGLGAQTAGGGARMSVVEVAATQRARVVEKPWGHEEIFALVEGKYCGKVLHVRAGHALSLQYHEVKDEFISVQRGTALLEIGDTREALTSIELTAGEGMHIPPGRVHRITALTDLAVLEASTTELDDVVRLADNYGREGAPGNGRIAQASVPAQFVPGGQGVQGGAS